MIGLALLQPVDQIHQILRENLSVSEPLIHTSESDWLVTQIDIGYDIPYLNSNNTKNASARITKFDFPLQVKHLDRVYQAYNKQLPYKGRCLRLEERALTFLMILQQHLLYHLCQIRSYPYLLKTF